jgi:putative oxidoreductase
MRAYGPTVLRLFLAAVFIAHGVEKLFGVRGGSLAGTEAMVSALHLPAAYPLAVAAAAGELACGILLLVGAFTLWAALVLLAARLVVFYQLYTASRLLMPSEPVGGTDVELSWLLIGALIALLLGGPGALSLDGQRVRSAERDAAARARLRAGKV